MTDKEQIERVARAMWSYKFGDPKDEDTFCGKWEDELEHWKESYRDDARAAITAIEGRVFGVKYVVYTNKWMGNHYQNWEHKFFAERPLEYEGEMGIFTSVWRVPYPYLDETEE